MPVPEHKRPTQRLTWSQRWLSLWLPVVGVWLVLWVVAKSPEGSRDWPTFLVMGITASAVLAGLWLVTVRMLESKAHDDRSAAEKLAEKGSRAALIYGGSSGTGPSPGAAAPKDAEADEPGSPIEEESDAD